MGSGVKVFSDLDGWLGSEGEVVGEVVVSEVDEFIGAAASFAVDAFEDGLDAADVDGVMLGCHVDGQLQEFKSDAFGER
jgi:hypothetical protein